MVARSTDTGELTVETTIPVPLRRAPPVVRKRVLAALADWPARHGYGLDERDRLIWQCIGRIVQAWGGSLVDPEARDLQAVDIKCSRGHVWRSNSFKLKSGLWCPECAAEHRRDGLDAMQKLARKHGGRCVSDVYVNSLTNLRWQCRHGHEWEMRPRVVKDGGWCPTCLAGELDRSGLKRMQTLARERGGKCLSDSYVNTRSKLRWQCKDGHVWEATPAAIDIAGAWCPVCAFDRRRLTLNDVNGMAAKFGGKCLSTTYSTNISRLRWRCAEGHEFEQSVAGLNKGQWCPTCSRAAREAAGLERVRLLAKERGGECLSDAYKGQHSPLRWCCEFGHIWRTAPINIRAGSWCHACARANQVVHTIEKMRAIARERGGECLSKEYVTGAKLKWRCAQGHTWRTSPAVVLIGCWCPACARASQVVYTIEEMRAVARERGGECLSEEYVNVSSKLEWQCARGHTWHTTPTIVLGDHWCPACANLDRSATHKARRKYLASPSLRGR